MATIRITPDSLESQAKTLNGYNEEHKAAFQKMKSLVESLSSEWEGEASEAFRQSFKTQETTLNKFSEEINSFRERMELAAREMRDAEAQVKSKMSNL